MHKALSKGYEPMTIYGYARVSTNGQDLGSQEAELLAAGCAKVFKEKVSGAKTDRAELAKVIRRLEPGDVLAGTRLDRLARPDPGPAQWAGRHRRGGSRLPEPERHLGRYQKPNRPADSDPVWE